MNARRRPVLSLQPAVAADSEEESIEDAICPEQRKPHIECFIKANFERFAGTWLGLQLIRRLDKMMEAVEHTAMWCSPKYEKSTLKLPMPWLFFLPLLPLIQLITLNASIISLLIGNGVVTINDLIYFIQTRRRKLRYVQREAMRRNQQISSIKANQVHYNIIEASMRPIRTVEQNCKKMSVDGSVEKFGGVVTLQETQMMILATTETSRLLDELTTNYKENDDSDYIPTNSEENSTISCHEDPLTVEIPDDGIDTDTDTGTGTDNVGEAPKTPVGNKSIGNSHVKNNAEEFGFEKKQTKRSPVLKNEAAAKPFELAVNENSNHSNTARGGKGGEGASITVVAVNDDDDDDVSATITTPKNYASVGVSPSSAMIVRMITTAERAPSPSLTDMGIGAMMVTEQQQQQQQQKSTKCKTFSSNNNNCNIRVQQVRQQLTHKTTSTTKNVRKRRN